MPDTTAGIGLIMAATNRFRKFLLVLLPILFGCCLAYDKSFEQHQTAKRLDGCVHKTYDSIPSSVLCSQYCLTEKYKCQSFNYLAETGSCEINWCAYNGLFSAQSLVNDADSIYIEVSGSQAMECTESFGLEQSTCHPYGTASCVEGTPTTGRVCNCYSFASGDDCSQYSTLCNNDNQCLELKSANSYSAAKTACENLNGFVYTVDSHVEQNRLRMFLERQASPPDVYLGFEYYNNYADFAISSNMQPLLGYTNWLTTENPTQRAACVKMSVADDYTWVDVDCSASLQYVCEVTSCPSGFSRFNGTCYHFDSGARYWARQVDYCRVRHTDARIMGVGYEEENTYVTSTYNSWGTGYAITLGINDYTEPRRFAWAHNDWILLDWNNPYKHLGCYVDSGNDRTMESLQSTWSLLTDDYQSRSDAVQKCFYATKLENYKIWGIQHSGDCRTSRTAADTYDKHGAGTGCSDGEGGRSRNDVYESYNPNLYVHFAFHSTAWMNDQRTYWWWHGDSWWWHDAGATTSGRAVCKIDSCPQGFHSHGSKCFKLNFKKQHRDLARDDCQRFTNGDLFNPEYSDELQFINNLISATGTNETLWWTGVYDEDEDGDQRYQVSQTNVYNSYNTYPIGSELVWRDSLDGAADLTSIELRYPMPADGKIVGWEYYSGRTGTTLKFSVMRAMATPAASNCPMMVVGVTSTTSGTSGEYHRLDLSASEQISVKQGDYLAITFRGGSNLYFTGGYEGGRNFCGSTDYHVDGSVGQTLTMNANYGRIYGFRGLFRTNTPEWSPFHEESQYAFNGGQCFYADTTYGFRLRDLSCDKNYPSVCEIKKRHRSSPDEITDI